jgi:hypothetical protein
MHPHVRKLMMRLFDFIITISELEAMLNGVVILG